MFGPVPPSAQPSRASNKSSRKIYNHPTWAFFWLKAPTSAFTYKTQLRQYAERTGADVKLGQQFKGVKRDRFG